MNLGELRAEVKARGFDYVTSTRIDRWINQAIRKINDLEAWPWLEKSGSGSITDLRTVQSVVDSSQGFRRLEWKDRRDLVDLYGDLSTTGSPRFYYLLNGVATTYPVGGSITVEYFSNTVDLSSDSDTPSIPAAYHNVIVDEAVRQAYKDSDNWDAANAIQADIAQTVDGMRNVLLDTQDDGTDFVRDTSGLIG